MWYIINSVDGKRFQVTGEGMTIGRENCPIVTPASDSRASRVHAMVRLCGDTVEVQDLQSSNGTYLDEQRINTITPWKAGQALRCGSTTFHLQYEPEPQRSAPTMMAPAGATMAMPEPSYSSFSVPPPAPVQFVPPAPVPAASFQAPPIPYQAPPAPYQAPPVQYQPAPPPLPPAMPVVNQYQYNPGTIQPAPATNDTVNIVGIVVGIMMLIIGIIGWQHYQPQMNVYNSMLGQIAINIGGGSVAKEVNQVKLYYTGSILLACVGGITVLASAIRLAMAHK